MPSDQHDPSCPSRDEPVGARATYCMHCGTEFTAAERDGVAGAADEAGATDFRDAGEEFIDDLASGNDTVDASTGDTAFGDTASGETPDTPTVEEPDTTPTVDGETGALAADSDSGGEATAVGQPESAETGGGYELGHAGSRVVAATVAADGSAAGRDAPDETAAVDDTNECPVCGESDCGKLFHVHLSPPWRDE
ncbi:hypothetical protein BRD06_05545 [Halobacteriales archaeon QS_9_67_15]|nr:MAG: hypothetical protein BRD06_05545 [Halobacteriales archaeon QS_9_67_15]